MKKNILIIAVFLSIFYTTFAYDFSAVCSSGQTLFFNIINDTSVAVTYPSNIIPGINAYSYMMGPYLTINNQNHIDMLPPGYDNYIVESNGSGLSGQLVQYFTYGFYGLHSSNSYALYSIPQTIYSSNHFYVLSDSSYVLYGDLIIPQYVYSDGLQYTVTAIGDYAFCNCANLNSISLPGSITAIGNYAFVNCINLNSISLPSSIFFIGKNAFINCDNVLGLNIDNASVTIGDGAFMGCDRLVNVNLGDSAISIGNSAFKDCFRLNNVQMGNSVTRIGNSAFEGCVRLPFPRLSNALTSIGDNAFKGCNLFSGEITIPAEVDTIGDYAFSGCSGVTSLNMKPHNPPIIFAHTFDSISINIPVYVPCGRVLNYYVTNYWENFPNILEAAF